VALSKASSVMCSPRRAKGVALGGVDIGAGVVMVISDFWQLGVC
jgi:hypothetical protein